MPEFDVVIKNGTIVDGTRVPRYRADVGIKNGRIARIGPIATNNANRILDATGLIVAPGFVDLHTHYDAQIQWDPWCTISGWHGVTSVAMGNCGFGFAPVRPEGRVRAMLTMSRNEAIPVRTMEKGMLWDWETFPEYMNTLDRIPKGINCLTYAPLAPFMIYVMGIDAAKTRGATERERTEIKRLLHQAMQAGACGLSLQKMGEGSIQADFDGTPMVTDTMPDEDIVAYAEVLRDWGGAIQIVYATGTGGTRVHEHDLLIQEKLAEVSGATVLHNAIAVLKYSPEFHRSRLDWLANVNARGLRIFAMALSLRQDMIFTLDEWNLYDNSPAWNRATTGTREEKVAKFADPEIREAMRKELDYGFGPGEKMLQTQGVGGPLTTVLLVGVGKHTQFEDLVGLTIAEIAEKQGKHPVDAMLDLALATDLEATFGTAKAGYNDIDPDLIAELFQSDSHFAVPGISDGGAHTKFFTGGAYTTDFLAWLVRDHGKLSLEEAHYRLSMLPAFAAGFRDRGYLREGTPADVVVYDLDKLARVPDYVGEIVHDLPGGEWRRIQRAEGYRWILVNGEITFENGVCTGATPGKLLRHGTTFTP